MTTFETLIMFAAGVITVIGIMSFFYVMFLRQIKHEEKMRNQQSNHLSYNEVNEIIEGIMMEIFSNKYLLYYKLKEITIIPKMDEEVTNITKEILAAFSDDLIQEFNRYYSKEFLIMMITRKVQILLVDYTNQNKPNTK